SQLPFTCQNLPAGIATGAGLAALTEMSRLISLQSAAGRSSASAACHLPAAGSATSATQKYGGPPCRADDFATTLPAGPVSDTVPSSGFSLMTMTRSGAPFQGANGEGRT